MKEKYSSLEIPSRLKFYAKSKELNKILVKINIMTETSPLSWQRTCKANIENDFIKQSMKSTINQLLQ